MASARDYLIIGDSNVRRFYNKLGRQVKTLEFVQARDYEEAVTALQSVNPSFKLVVFAFITNLIINAGEDGQDPSDRLSAISEMFNGLLQMLK